MSRTYRKRERKFENSYTFYHQDFYVGWFGKNNEKYLKQEKAKYYSDKLGVHACYTLPREFRNSVNRHRRGIDKRELYKEINHFEYEGLYCAWNCKTNNHWGYW